MGVFLYSQVMAKDSTTAGSCNIIKAHDSVSTDSCESLNESKEEYQFMLARDAVSETTSSYTSIHDAVKANDLIAVKQFIKKDKASVNFQKQVKCDSDAGLITCKIEPLHCAILENLTDMAKYLVDNGANVNAWCMAKKFTPLHLAADANNFELVEYLVKHGAAVNAKRGSAIYFLHDCRACSSALFYAHDPKIITYLIKAGCNPNERGLLERTALFYAAINNDLDAVKCLVDNGADVNLKTKFGETALSLANHYHEVVKYLKDKGAVE